MFDPAYLIVGVLMFLSMLGAHTLFEIIGEFHRQGMERIRKSK